MSIQGTEGVRPFTLHKKPWGTMTLAVVCGFAAALSGYGLIYRGLAISRNLYLYHGYANLMLGIFCMVFAVLLLRRERGVVLGTFFSVFLITLLNSFLRTMGEAGYYFSLLTLLFCANLVFNLKPSG